MMEKFDSINLVVQYIRNGILSDKWKIGEKIPSEHEICNALHVSRNSVRCALAQYISLGVLKSVHGKGTYVCSNSNQLAAIGSGVISNTLRQTMISILDFRCMLEPDICYYAALRITGSEFKQLQDLLDAMLHSTDRQEWFVHMDCSFHLLIAKASKNQIAEQILSKLFQDNLVFFIDMNRALGSCNAYYYHSAVLEALEKRDSQKARQSMREHLEKSLSELQLS